MRHLFVLCAILIGVSYSTSSESNGTYGENVDGSGLIKLGRKLHKPMLTLIGMAIQNLHPCKEWTPWSSCDASRQGYFGSQTRTRSCTNTDQSDEKTMTTENDNRVCEGLCPVSYNLTNNGFCIKLNTTTVSNDVAVKQCELEGGYLIHIDSQQNSNDLKTVIQGFSTNLHIEGRRIDATSPWMYKYGSQNTFLKWATSYPTNTADRLCLVLQVSTQSQYDHRCSSSRPFVCEILIA